MKAIACVLAGALVLSVTPGAAQTPLPEDRRPVTQIATDPPGTFFESVVVVPSGDLVVTERTAHRILRVAPDGERTTLLDHPRGLAGLAVDLDGTLYATSGPQEGDGYVLVIDPDGTITREIAVPGAPFLNGATVFAPGVLLVADSTVGTVFRVDTRSGSVEPWLSDPSLSPDADALGIPGANGVKVFDGAVYVSNSARATLLRVPIAPDGRAGAVRPVLAGTVLDDFAIAADGTVYAATHVFNSVVRIEPDGTATTIATAQDGATGATAAAFGRRDEDADALFVVTNGGAFLPPPTGIVPAEILRIDVGELGLAPIEALSHLPHPGEVGRLALWRVRCVTADGTEALREAVGPRYLRYLELHADRIAFAGQLFGEGATSPTERLYFVTASDRPSARRLMENSPYARSGLYATCEADRFDAVVGALLGGAAWPADRARPAE